MLSLQVFKFGLFRYAYRSSSFRLDGPPTLINRRQIIQHLVLLAHKSRSAIYLNLKLNMSTLFDGADDLTKSVGLSDLESASDQMTCGADVLPDVTAVSTGSRNCPGTGKTAMCMH